MKNIITVILFSFLICGFLKSNAQLYLEKAYKPDFHSKIAKSTYSENYHLLFNEDYLYVIDTLGLYIKNTYLEHYDEFPFFFINNRNNQIAILSAGFDAAYYPSDACISCYLGSYFFMQTFLNNNFNVLKSEKFNEFNTVGSEELLFNNSFNPLEYLKKVYFFNDSSTIAVFNSFVYYSADSIYKNGQFIKTHNTNDTIVDAVVINDSSFYLFTNSSIQQASINDTIANIKHYITSRPVAITKLTNNKIFYLDVNLNIFSLDSLGSLNILGSFSNLIDSIIDIQYQQDTILILGKNADMDYVFISLDQDFDIIDSNIFKNPGFEAVGFNTINNRVELFGNEKTYKNSHFILKSYDKNTGATELNNIDAGISNMTIDYNVNTFSYNINVSPDSTAVRYADSVKLTIKYKVCNFSSDTIKNFYANYQIKTDDNCGINKQFFEKISNQIITQNDTSSEITWNTSFIIYQDNWYQTSRNFEICVWTSAPNDKIDRNHTNDYWCENRRFVSVYDFEKNSNNIEIFPNPSNGVFNIQLKNIEDFSSSIQVVDILNKVVYEKTINENNYMLNLSNLPNGIYNVLIQNTNNVYLERILIQH